MLALTIDSAHMEAGGICHVRHLEADALQVLEAGILLSTLSLGHQIKLASPNADATLLGTVFSLLHL